MVKRLLGYNTELLTIKKDNNNKEIQKSYINEAGLEIEFINSISKNKKNNKTLLIIEDDWYRSHIRDLEKLVSSNHLDILTFKIDVNKNNQYETNINKIIEVISVQPQKEYNNIAILAHGRPNNHQGIHRFQAFGEKASIDTIRKLKEAVYAKNVILSSCYAGSNVANKYKETVIENNSDESITVIGEDGKQVIIENAVIGLKTLLNSKVENNDIFKLDVDVAKKITQKSALDVSFIKGTEKINSSIDKKVALFTNILSSFGIIDKKADQTIALYKEKDHDHNASVINKLLEDNSNFISDNANENLNNVIETLINDNDNSNSKQKESSILNSIIEIYHVNLNTIMAEHITNSYDKDGTLNKEALCNAVLHTFDRISTENNDTTINNIIVSIILENLRTMDDRTKDTQAILSALLNNITKEQIGAINSIIKNKQNDNSLIDNSELINKLPKKVYIKCIHEKDNQMSNESSEENVDNMSIASIISYLFFQPNLYSANLQEIASAIINTTELQIKTKAIDQVSNQANISSQLAIEYVDSISNTKDDQLEP